MWARKHKKTHGYPAVIFIDEADAILGKRGSGISSDMERTIVPMFLAEMDGLEDSGAVMLLSTNRPDVLDPAIVRDGRIDRKVKVDRPDKDSAVEVFKLHLRGMPFSNGYTVQDMAVLGRDQLFSDRNRLYDIHVSTDKDDKVIPFTLGNLINGAMIAGIVDQATSLAIHRDISKGGDPKGLTKDDVIGAIDCTYEQNRDLNHQDELAEFVRDFRKDVVQIKRSDRVKQVEGDFKES
jgi:proteasome-associated ATPase